MDTICVSYLIEQTESFAAWLAGLRDLRGKIAIARRLDRAAQGNLGDSKSVGDSVSELRINVGPGYRVYFTLRHEVMIILLAGGDKSSQAVDIRRAKQLAKGI